MDDSSTYPAPTDLLNKQLSITALFELCAAIAPPRTKAIENVKFEFLILTSSPYNTSEPPSPIARDAMNEEFKTVKLLDSFPTNTVPPFTANEFLNVEFAI